MDLLIPSTGLLFWMSLTFLVVLGILWKWGFPAIVNMINERKAFIDESLRKAHEANEKLAGIQEESESILQQAREKQALILKDAATTRESMISQAQDKARVESARLLADAKTEIESEIRAQVAELSVLIAEKVVRQKLSSDKEQNELINRLLDDMTINAN